MICLLNLIISHFMLLFKKTIRFQLMLKDAQSKTFFVYARESLFAYTSVYTSSILEAVAVYIDNKFAFQEQYITMIIFTSSVQHAASNFGQFEMYKFIPNAPVGMRLPPHKKGEVRDCEIFLGLCFKVLNHRAFKRNSGLGNKQIYWALATK